MNDKGIFTRIEFFFNENMTQLTKIISDLFANDLMSLMTTGLTIYVVFYGYLVLAGKIQAPIEDLIWNLARFALLITFLNNTGGWLDLTKEAIEEISSIGTGGKGLEFIDKQIIVVAKLINKMVNEVPWYAEYFVIVVMWIGFGLSCVPAVLLIMANKISMYILMALLPLFIFCLMWGWLKESFNRYMSALLSNALVIIVVTTVLKAIVLFFGSFDLTGMNVALACFGYVVVGLFGGFTIKYLAGICSSLMSVSIEKIPTTKSFQKASYDSSSGVAESKKAKMGRYTKNAVGSVYNRLKL